MQTFKTEYDYGSVMHYGKNAFSKNGLATIVPRKNVSIGQRIGFSNLDLQEINALYQCNSKHNLSLIHIYIQRFKLLIDQQFVQYNCKPR